MIKSRLVQTCQQNMIIVCADNTKFDKYKQLLVGVGEYKKNTFEIKDKKIEYVCKIGKGYFEINPSNYNHKDFVVLGDFLSKVGKTYDVSTLSRKLILINDAHKLSDKAQFMLRRLMEKRAKILKFVLFSENSNSIISAIKSRCQLIYIPCPLPLPTKESSEICKMIMTYSCVDDLVKIREYLYELMIKNINMSILIRDITRQLTAKKVIKNAQKYEHRLIKGNNTIFHVEAFIFSVIKLTKNI